MSPAAIRSTLLFPLMLVALMLGSLLFGTSTAMAGQDSVRAVYFSSPECPFCTIISQDHLDPLQKSLGEELELLTVDTTTEDGARALRQFWVDYDVPSRRRGVPTVVVGDEVLVGAQEIPAQFPKIVDQGLLDGGIDWPAVAGLESLQEAAPPPPVEATEQTLLDRIAGDLPGNAIAILLLIILLAVAASSVPRRSWQERLRRATPRWLKVLVAFIGLGVASYLAWGEVTRQDLFCGPVGQCNIVQHSDMAMLFGVLPLAVLGVAAYASLLGIYGIRLLRSWSWHRLVPAAALGLTSFGFGFSMLLTFWQPFVIGATCAWCLASAITMTLCFLFNLEEGRDQWKVIRHQGLAAVLRSDVSASATS